MRPIYLAITAGIVMISSCQKKSNKTATAADLKITIASPTAGQVYHTGDSVHISASISYPTELHGFELRIIDSATGTILSDTAQDVHNDHFDITQVWIDTAIHTATTLKLEVVGEIDHTGTSASKELYFKIQP